MLHGATDLAGVVHLHSLYSDGTGTVPEIARAARANGLDFVLLTDHDTLAARDRGEEGWHGNVLVLVGEEVSPKGQDHFLAFGLERPIDHRGMTAGQILAAVDAAGGFGFAAHPFSEGSQRFRRAGRGMPWTDFDAPGLAGIEAWSFVTDSAERVNSIRELVHFIVRPQSFVDHPPQRNLREWDRLGAARRCAGIGGLDAHQVGIRVGKRVPLRLMAYRRSFRFLRTHLLVSRPLSGELGADRDTVLSALRAGSAYIAMDALAPARGFGFAAEGHGAPPMGGEAPAAPLTLRVHAPRAAALRLLCDGRQIAAAANATELACDVERPGVYRVEARLRAHGRERTWILSNPIYLR
jgi:hypothetical protein